MSEPTLAWSTTWAWYQSGKPSRNVMLFSSGRPCCSDETIWLSDMFELSRNTPAWNFGAASVSRVYRSNATVLRIRRRSKRSLPIWAGVSPEST